MEIAVTAPETLIKYDAPMFAGIESTANKLATKTHQMEPNAKLEDMVNAMLPPRFLFLITLFLNNLDDVPVIYAFNNYKE